MAGHVTNPATKLEDPKTIRSWVTSYNVSHWLALKMRTRPLCMRRITWPVSRGSKIITYLESPTPICLFTIHLLLGYCPVEMGPKMSVLGKMGVETLDFGFATSKRHFLARNRVVWRILRQNRRTRLGCSLSQGPQNKQKKVAESLCAEGREITHAQNRNP